MKRLKNVEKLLGGIEDEETAREYVQGNGFTY